MRQGKSDIRARQCESTNPLVDMIKLCPLGAQELLSRRRIVKEVVHLDGRSDRVRCGNQLTYLAVVRLNLPGARRRAGRPVTFGLPKRCSAALLREIRVKPPLQGLRG